MFAELALFALITLAVIQWFRDFLTPKADVNEVKAEAKGRLTQTSKRSWKTTSPRPSVNRRLSPIFEGAKDDEVPKFTGNARRQNKSYQPYVSGRRASVMAAGL